MIASFSFQNRFVNMSIHKNTNGYSLNKLNQTKFLAASEKDFESDAWLSSIDGLLAVLLLFRSLGETFSQSG